MISEVTVWVVTTDRDLLRRWEPALLAEGWRSAVVPEIKALVGVVKVGGAGPAALAIIDADLLAESPPKFLAALRAGGLPYLLFGRKDRHDDASVIGQLNAGANDFFDPQQEAQVIIARLRAHVRGLGPNTGVIESPGKWVKLDTGARTAWCRAKGKWQQMPHLTAKEYALLLLFLRRAGTVLRRREILEGVWGDPAADVNPETVDRHIVSLRRKMGAAGPAIQTVYGVGYAFNETPRNT